MKIFRFIFNVLKQFCLPKFNSLARVWSISQHSLAMQSLGGGLRHPAKLPA
ncbi:hypothetical protein [Mesorhizobium sp. M7A.F.Ca.US.008.03.1.1]|uniref:hypothetical protein n=1 Tax=Mesorhizobium sp. M7A.F.Ca.US.008.03.1.1 TaxID=2496742 RepID=UPI0013E024A9|nr:hypothetical protein [Mesorhizobium sp. M7A.F.Ca.US.008.03.1.1]